MGHSFLTSSKHVAVEVGAWLLGRRRRFRVTGRSMLPGLAPDSFVLIDPARRPAVGDVVVARHPSKSIDVIKRVAAIDGERFELRSDNASVGSDSRDFGLVDQSAVKGVMTVVLSTP